MAITASSFENPPPSSLDPEAAKRVRKVTSARDRRRKKAREQPTVEESVARSQELEKKASTFENPPPTALDPAAASRVREGQTIARINRLSREAEARGGSIVQTRTGRVALTGGQRAEPGATVRPGVFVERTTPPPPPRAPDYVGGTPGQKETVRISDPIQYGQRVEFIPTVEPAKKTTWFSRDTEKINKEFFDALNPNVKSGTATDFKPRQILLAPAYIGAEALKGAWSAAKAGVKVFTDPAGTLTSLQNLATSKEYRKNVLKQTILGAKERPFFFAGGVAADVLLPGVALKAGRRVKTFALSKYDKYSDLSPFYVEKVLEGNELHKGGGFQQYLATYKGESITRGGKTFGVRRVQPFNILKPSSYTPALRRLGERLGIQSKGASRPGQIQYFDPVGEDVLFRDVPSEFANPQQELSLAGTRGQSFATVTPNSQFLQQAATTGKPYRVILGGGKELESLSGRAGVGGAELSQFGAPRTLKDIDIGGGRTFPAGGRQAYIYYADFKEADLLSVLRGDAKLSLFGKDAGVGFSQQKATPSPRINYVESAQDIYQRPGQIRTSPSTQAGIRTEAELLAGIGTQKSVKEINTFRLEGLGDLKGFYERNIPIKEGSKAYQDALRFNIGQIEGRIKAVETFAEGKPSQQAAAQNIISREQANINRLNKLLGEEPRFKDLSPVSQKPSAQEQAFLKEFGSSQRTLPTVSVAEALASPQLQTPRAALSSAPQPTTSSLSGLEVSRTTSITSRNDRSTFSASSPSSYDLGRSFIPPKPSSISVTPQRSTPVISTSFSTASRSISTPSTTFSRSSRRSSPSDVSTSFSPAASTLSPSASLSTSRVSASFSPRPSRFSGSSSPPTRIITPPFFSARPRIPSDKSRGRFTVQVLEKGRFTTIGTRPTLTGAVRTGRAEVGGRALRTFRVLKGFTPIKVSLPGFRPSKSRPGGIVETSRLAINTPGELRDIPGARRKRRRGGLI